MGMIVRKGIVGAANRRGNGMALPDTSRDLLKRAKASGDDTSWRRLTELYAPLIRNWVRPYVAQPADADDVVQDVMIVLFDELPRFEHNGRPGAFRSWLRAIAVNRLRNYWYCRRGPQGSGTLSVMEQLEQLENPASPLSRAWDDEHDRHVTDELLESIRIEFQPATWHAFLATTRDGRPAQDVAAELGLSVNAVLIAKSRVIKRLRQKASGLLD
jgi:RNA polymerase sigma-70 factor (ECF subfamily)